MAIWPSAAGTEGLSITMSPSFIFGDMLSPSICKAKLSGNSSEISLDSINSTIWFVSWLSTWIRLAFAFFSFSIVEVVCKSIDSAPLADPMIDLPRYFFTKSSSSVTAMSGFGRIWFCQKCVMPAAVLPSSGIQPGWVVVFSEFLVFESDIAKSFSMPFFSHSSSMKAVIGSVSSGFLLIRASIFRKSELSCSANEEFGVFFSCSAPVNSHIKSAPVIWQILRSTSMPGILLFS